MILQDHSTSDQVDCSAVQTTERTIIFASDVERISFLVRDAAAS